jgi:Predicted membrane protein (DUF2306)
MHKRRSITWRQVLSCLAAVLVLKVTAVVIWGYRNYFPANFNSTFLIGREDYFWGEYRWAFYAHIVAGPTTLVLGLILMSERFRLRLPQWHRLLGKCQIALIVVLLAPSGLWMARYAETGPIAASGFAALAIATACFAPLGWRSAVQRRFADHRRWMWRSFLLLCSAVVLRLIGGLALVTGIGRDWSYPLAAWVSWLLPLAAFELLSMIERRSRSRQVARAVMQRREMSGQSFSPSE